MTASADAIGSRVPRSGARPNASAATVVRPFHPMRAVVKLEGQELRRVRDRGKGSIGPPAHGYRGRARRLRAGDRTLTLTLWGERPNPLPAHASEPREVEGTSGGC